MLKEMNYDLVFDRKIDKKKHYISPGGYGVETKDKEFDFDFTNYSGTIDKKDAAVLHVSHTGLDTDSFPDAEKIISTDIQTSEFTEFYIYTGEAEDMEIHPKAVRNLSFIFDDSCVTADKKLLSSANKVITD